MLAMLLYASCRIVYAVTSLSHSFANFVNVLVHTQIISLDPTFIEAYNRRATALFGLHRAQECFADLEHVLRANPMHYGALCGKVCFSFLLILVPLEQYY